MWRVYLLEFIIVLIVSIVWMYLIDKEIKEKDGSGNI